MERGFLDGSYHYLKLKELLTQQNGGMSVQFAEAETGSSACLGGRVQLEKEMAGSETTEVSTGLITMSTGLMLQAMGGAHGRSQSNGMTPMDFHMGRSLR